MKNMKWMLAALILTLTVVFIPGKNVFAYGYTQAATTKNSVTVTWERPVSDSYTINKYTVYIVSNSVFGEKYEYSFNNVSPKTTLDGSATQYTFTGLKAGTKYNAKIAYDYTTTYGSTYSGTMSDTIVTLPDKVTGVKQTKWWYWANNADFTWNEQDACKYEFTAKTVKGKKFASDSGIYSNSASINKVKNTMTYTVQVRAVLELNGKTYKGNWSDKAYLFCQPMVTSCSVSKNKLTVKWGKVSGMDKYKVYVSLKEKKGYKLVKTLSSKKNSLTIKKFKKKAIKASKKYYVYIVGIKKVGSRTYTSGKHYTSTLYKKNHEVNWTFN